MTIREYQSQLRHKIELFRKRGFIVENMAIDWIEDLIQFGYSKEEATEFVKGELK